MGQMYYNQSVSFIVWVCYIPILFFGDFQVERETCAETSNQTECDRRDWKFPYVVRVYLSYNSSLIEAAKPATP